MVRARSCRESVNDSSNGCTRYLLAPYVRAEMPARTYAALARRSKVTSGGGFCGLRRNSG